LPSAGPPPVPAMAPSESSTPPCVQTRAARKVQMAPAASSSASGQSIVAGTAASIFVVGAGPSPSRSKNRSASAGRTPSTPPMPRGSGHTKQDTAQPISHMPYEIYCG
jgi:hypothetical protein